MRLTAKIVAIFVLGAIPLTVIHGYLTVWRENQRLKQAMEQEAQSIGRAMEETVVLAWRESGHQGVVQFLRRADDQYKHLAIRWLALDVEQQAHQPAAPVERLPVDSIFKPMRQTEETSFVSNVMHTAVTCKEDEPIQTIAERIVTQSVNHIVVVDDNGRLRGIVTSWDITRAMAEGRKALADVVSRRVVTAESDEPLETASKRMAQNNISALPVINSAHKVLGIVTSEDVSKLLGR